MNLPDSELFAEFEPLSDDQAEALVGGAISPAVIKAFFSQLQTAIQTAINFNLAALPRILT